MKILFVRHGETELNVLPKKMQGISDYNLNKNGIIQAEKVRDVLENEKIDVMIVSPLKRALQTAQIINQKHNIELIVDDRIKELNYGDLEGTMYKKEYWDMDYDYSSIHGENIKDLKIRVYKFIEEIKIKYSNKTVLVVSHGGVARMFRCYFEGIPNNKNLANYGIKNCEVKEFYTE